MAFIGNYWWAILVIAGLVIYTWRGVRRASQSVSVEASGRGVHRRAGNREALSLPDLRFYLVLLAGAAVAAMLVARGFPLVNPEFGDYLIVGLIGCMVATAFAIGRVPLFPGAQQRTSDGTFFRAFVGLVFGVSLGGSLLVIANGYFDAATAREVRTVVARRDCANSALILHGAPDLPAAVNSLRITRHTAV